MMEAALCRTRLKNVRDFLLKLGRLPKQSPLPAEAFIAVCQDGIGWEDIYYLTGFIGSSSVLLLTQEDAILFVDPRYIESARATEVCRTVCCSDVRRASPLQAALDHLSLSAPKKIAYGGRRFSHVAYRFIESALGESVEMVDLSNLMLNMRRHKCAAEVRCIRDAVAVAEGAFLETLAEAKAGMSERDFAGLLAYRIHRAGGDFGEPLPIMVAAGERTALPHSVPSDKKFMQGDLVMVDFGARSAGYVCDITRMISIGEPSEEAKTLYSILKWAQTEASALIAPRRAACDIDAASRTLMTSAGLGDFFVHGVGHGIGLSIHEPPSLGESSSATLAEGDVITVEPGFYRPGWGGMRVEDDYLVTPTGCKCLTESLSREFFVVS